MGSHIHSEYVVGISGECSIFLRIQRAAAVEFVQIYKIL